jgi:hypothetical protein
MRSVTLALTLALAGAEPALAGRILFATEASPEPAAVDGFCIRSDDSLEPTPTVRVTTGGLLPRRLVVKPDPATGTDGVLYVAEADRVEAFRIGQHGGLAPAGSTDIETGPNMNPLDVAVSADGRLLYVPQSGRDRIVTYPLDADGALPKDADFTSCVNGRPGTLYERILVRGGLLYASTAVLGGRISVFPLGADGSLSLTPDACKGDRGIADETCALSERRKLLTPGPFAITDGGLLYVESLATRRVLTFQLASGLFGPVRVKKTGEAIDLCLNEKKEDPVTGPFTFQKPLGKTAVFQQYHDLALHPLGKVLYGSQFTHGRVDAYRIKSSGKLPKHPSRRTKEDVRLSPVGIAVSDGALYVATGEFDRVQVFRVKSATGMLRAATPFSETSERRDSFPNALAIAELSGGCR